jgi:hypothetical protein
MSDGHLTTEELLARGNDAPTVGKDYNQPSGKPERAMSQRERYAEARRVLSEIRHELDTAPLTPQQRNELELHAAKLAGALLHPWFPVAWPGRLIAAGIVLLGLQQAWTGNYEPMVFWLLLPLFSPRIMGWCFFQIGRVRRLLRS